MLLPYYMISFILKHFMTFSMLHDCVICDYDIYNHPITDIISLLYFVICVTIIHNVISYFLSKFKIKNSKMK